jgi:hypothetical protein
MVSCIVLNYFVSNSENLETISCCKHKTNFRKRAPFTAQYYNLNNYPPRTLSTCVLQPSSSKPDVHCSDRSVQYATGTLCGLTTGSSCVIGSYVRVCANIYICCDLSRSVELMADTATVFCV